MNAAFPLPEPYAGKDFAKVVLDDGGRPLRYFSDSEGVWRYQVSISEVSPKYLEALIGYEDRFFYYHPGVNPASLIRSAWQYVKNGRIVSGGSTLTMQVARIIDPHSRTVPGKIKQILRAIQLELKYSKDEILEMYLNLAPFGGNIQGVQAASYTYFDRGISDINHTEAALLAVLPQAPSRLRPDRHHYAASEAKDKVAERMLEYGYWSEDIVNDVLSEQLVIFTEARPMLAPLLAERLVNTYPDERVIRTYIDRDLQEYLEALLIRESNGFPPGTSAALLVIENESMRVTGYAGSIEYGNETNFGYIDMVSSVRSPGSALKPFIYGMALDKGLIHSHSLLLDAPRVFSSYQAGNFRQNFSGAVSVQSALQRSLNVPAVQVMEHVTPEYFYASILNAGVKFPLLGNKPNVSIALGGGGMRLDGLAVLFTALGNKGLVGGLLYTDLDEEVVSRPIMSEEAAYIVYEMLRRQYRYDHFFIEDVTGKRNRLAWKTGTSYGFRDAIAVGVTPKHTIAVWVGRPDNVPTPDHYGAVTAAPILFNISDWLEYASPDELSDIERPEKVLEISICWPSGLAEELTEESNCHQKHIALTIEGATPATLPETPEDVNQTYMLTWLENSKGFRVNQRCMDDKTVMKTASVWPRLLEPWVSQRYRRNSILPKWDSSCDLGSIIGEGGVIITGVVDKSTLKTASTDGGLPKINLSAAGGIGTVVWYLNGEYIASTEGALTREYQMTETGTFQLVAVDGELQSAYITFYVD